MREYHWKVAPWAILLCATLAWLAADGVVLAAARTWVDQSGDYSVEAEFVSATDETVRLRRHDGRMLSIMLNQLSTADQQYIKQRIAEETKTKTEEPKTSETETSDTTTRPTISKPTDALIELQSGSRVNGRITEWDDQYVAFVITMSGREFDRKYPVDKLLAITIDGKRYSFGASGVGSRGTSGTTGASISGKTTRTLAEVEALIARQGRAQPDWWDEVPLDYPKTLDLSWPQKPPPPWNPQKNVGQYLWDVIHPNPNKWRSGIRLVHYLLEMHATNSEKRSRAMMTLGRMYLKLEQDYARAAFWYRQAGADRRFDSPTGVTLAECYWKLGNKQMAMMVLQKNALYYSSIKLLGDMGETDEALRLAESGARGGSPDVAYLHAGDACRIAGRYEQALEYYQKVTDVRPSGKATKRIQRNHARARANMEGIRLFDALDLSKIPNGTYKSSSPGYVSDIQIAVTVMAGRITDVKVIHHKEKQFFSSIRNTTQQIVEKQSVRGIDTTSSATITSEAIINATAKALAGATK